MSEDYELAALLAQMEEQGLVTMKDGALLLPWQNLYAVMNSPDYVSSFPLLKLPALSPIRPCLASAGSFSDEGFSIFITGWVMPDGSPTVKHPHITGAVIEPLAADGEAGLLEKEVWQTLQAIGHFHERPSATRSAQSNRLCWATIRRHALAARAHLNHFLFSTPVVAAQSLELGLRCHKVGGNNVVEVIPNFPGEPENWMEVFDRLNEVRDHYEVPHGEGMSHVEISPEVKTVLREIKRMPGRRIAGERAEAFLRNPFAALGPDTEKVIDPAQFEHERTRAGITFAKFIVEVNIDSDSSPTTVGLRIDLGAQSSAPSEVLPFWDPADLDEFIEKISKCIRRGFQCCSWRGYELELLGDASDQLDILRRALTDWRVYNRRKHAEVFDPTQYSDRIVGFGVEAPYSSPFVRREIARNDWFPQNVALDFPAQGPAGPIQLSLSDETLPVFRRELQAAKDEERAVFSVPFLPEPISVSQAEELMKCLSRSQPDVAVSASSAKREWTGSMLGRQGLVLKPNVHRLDYEEPRTLPSSVGMQEAVLPTTLRNGVCLKAHQLAGVAWLQRLWSLSPKFCRGALVADEMGLGKTIQLLTFVARCLEDDPLLDPFLIVAPVSLLETWKEEIEKFFQPSTLPILSLYGAAIRKRRLPQSEIEYQLYREGIVTLLSEGWLGGAKVVLTTYETLRDLEFSLAQQKWSAMICDEAQKIKTPNALVTRAAKKQNARFKIACTGTPVENTLVDLWCLFDFVQPGLLGCLQDFGQHYRRPIEAETMEDKSRLEELKRLIEPQILRRTTADVAKDLPPKIVDLPCRSLSISKIQRAYYADALSAYRRRGGSAAYYGLQSQFGLLRYLRILCSDPGTHTPFFSTEAPTLDPSQSSPKLQWLLAQLDRIKELREKAIVFCEVKDLQRTLQRGIMEHTGFVAEIINGDSSVASGSVRNRQSRIRYFQEAPGFGVVILSPLAVGFGINIQAASHVIHFTRTWNPSLEDQATGRAYRMGQVRTVFVYCPTVVAKEFVTFDAMLDRLLETKRKLSRDMLNGCGDLTLSDFAGLEGPLEAVFDESKGSDKPTCYP
jgi:hypothetical protein